MSGGAKQRVSPFATWLRWAVLAMLIAVAQPAWALRCLADGGADSLTEPIGGVASYPTDAPDGYVIWVSPPRTTTGYCYKDYGGAALNFAEQVYFYANPRSQDPAAWGLEIGIRYGGRDYFGLGSGPGARVETTTTVGTCSQWNFDRGLCPKVPLSITYQVVVRKKGQWMQPPNDIYAVFQFDGKGGLNAARSSFQYRLSGLSRLKPTPCLVDVLVTPEPGIVNFGQVQTTGNGFLPAVPRRRFSLSLSKKCSIPIRVDGYFEATKGAVQNGLLVSAKDSNFGIGLEDSQGKPIDFNKQFTLTQFAANVANQTVMLDAVLKSFGPPKIGPFDAAATIRIFLY
ncbi:fimbrial protein [Burkholderia cenocepacia]|uniref:fimbrial protein n=1 Tax=Burkholderia cenocepacia TaxID=95486 RepID=UPI00209EB347|nr:fimbrial protein [Burkholderia cenocepacia]MCO8322050.1 fimbrial protein [Burkholderia cenocepacia]MCO8329334.1 fimbrial protein [Burkholderia cenocepacia]MCO8336545.1 fimbrial protein [Burkholderia cenocepacia]MCO8343830.1 fimbrial protein [Burkholderia cenocepacia]MCO8357187.1 fimbrial protein [Burkholderia cenocepacia]